MVDKSTAIEEQLTSLFTLQLIDSKLDNLQNIRGELPMEVNDLEDEIEGLKTRVENIDNSIDNYKNQIEELNNKINEANTLTLKYESQQTHVKNNREYVAISKEIELQKLEKMAADKKIKEYKSDITVKEEQKVETTNKLDESVALLADKEKELDEIIGETQKEAENIKILRNGIEPNVEERLLKAYNKIRETYKNHLAVVIIERESCGGCFSQIPPQRQLDIRLYKKIIVCENCGRVLIDHKLGDSIKEEFNK